MKKQYHHKIKRLILYISLLFIFVALLGIFSGSKYINQQLLQANQNMAIDIALLAKNNFHITDDEVSYMKSLTFNEMEVDAINYRSNQN